MRLLAIPVLLATLLACAEDVGKDKVKAAVADVPAAEAPAPPPEEGFTSVAVDPARSRIEALGAKITAQHPIVFHEYRGKLGLKDGDVGMVAFVVKMASLEADHPKLTEHLRNEDFFDVGKFPEATFTSTSVTPGGTDGATHTVTGDLTIRGTTKRVTFPATLAVTDAEVTASTEFVIDRQDFGVTYPGKPDDLIQDNVRMTIALVAPRT